MSGEWKNNVTFIKLCFNLQILLYKAKNNCFPMSFKTIAISMKIMVI